MAVQLPTVSVVGLGKLGIPFFVCLAHKGFKVIGVDIDKSKIEAINRHVAPVHEPGLQALLESSGSRIEVTSDHAAAVRNSDVTFISVPTPSEPSGAFSLRCVLEACRTIGEALRLKSEFHLIVLRSTVMPGATGGEVQSILEQTSGKTCGIDFGLCYNPEFIALGKAISDFLNPALVLVGESDPRSGELLIHLYQQFWENKPPVVRTKFVNAELAKIALNTFVTTKISFANMLARLCEQLPGADVETVASTLGLDSRIGPRYLKGAISYGGPCFPRDNRALVALARGVGSPAELAEATHNFNQKQLRWLADLVKAKLGDGGRVGVLGLTYKPDTDVVEESAGLWLAKTLAEEGISVVAYDPVGMENARRVLGERIQFSPSVTECIDGSQVVVITTPWKEFGQIGSTLVGRAGRPRVVIDCWRILGTMMREGIEYVPLGVGTITGK